MKPSFEEALHAIWADNADAMQKMIARGLDLTQTDDAGNSLLIIAVKNDAADVVHILLKNGIDVDVRNKDGKTAMDLILNDGRIRAILMKDMILRHRRSLDATAQQAEHARGNDFTLKMQRLKQRAPKVKLKGAQP